MIQKFYNCTWGKIVIILHRSNSTHSRDTQESNESYESDAVIRFQSGDTDSEDETSAPTWIQPPDDLDEQEDDEESKRNPPAVLLKERPKHKYIIIRGMFCYV